MSREALVLLVCCCDFRDGAERLIPSKSLRNAVIRAFPGLFRILRMCAPRRAAAVVRPRGREKSADRRRRILISRLLIIRAFVPRRKSPFPAYFKGFPAVSPLIPPYPAFLKYPVSPHQTIQSAMAGVRRIDAFLAQPERAVPKRNETAARGDVALSHVTFGYGEKPVLRDFSMTVRQGEQVMLVGRTGAGKSTVFKLLLGLYQPEAGTVTIGGVDVSRISDQERRTCIGCVEQHFSRVPGSVLDQITLGDPQITAAMAKNAAQLAGIDAAVQALPKGYDTVCMEGMFSQGEWQLLSIARAAAADPAVLLLDEITANLDAETEARVLEALRRASAGRTVLSVSHRIYENLGGRTIEVRAQA